MVTYELGDPLLTINNLSLKYGDKLILRNIDLVIKDIIGIRETLGQVITVVGKSGIGKSQLFKLIAGLIKPTTGEIYVGKEQKPVEPGEVGMVLQNYPLFMHRTLLSNLQMVCKDTKKIDFLLNEFDILDHKGKYPGQLSGGQRQRSAIVQQLLCSNHFILLDEPFSGLDPVATDKLCDNLSRIANLDNNNTVIISSHILAPSLAISDMLLVLGNEYETISSEVTTTEVTVKKRKIEGATILYKEDLAAQGLAWRPDIRKDPAFIELLDKIRSIFHTI